MTTTRWHLLSLIPFASGPVAAFMAIDALWHHNWMLFLSALLLASTGAWLYCYCFRMANRCTHVSEVLHYYQDFHQHPRHGFPVVTAKVRCMECGCIRLKDIPADYTPHE